MVNFSSSIGDRMVYIQCSCCGGLYNLDNIDNKRCDWCGNYLDIDEDIKKRMEIDRMERTKNVGDL